MRENPVTHVTANLLMNAQLLEAGWRAGVKRILYVSSSTVYPVQDHPRREEEGFLGEPHPAYFGVGWMKRYTEKLCAFYAQRFGMEVALIRPTNVYGPGDKFDPELSHVLPALVRKALEGGERLDVWGSGEAVRDFIYVTDLVEALLAVLENHATCDPINVGSGKRVTLHEAIKVILKLTGRTGMSVVYDPSKPTTIHTQMVDVSKSRALLGFGPRISLEEGLRRTIEWYKSARTGGLPAA
jgi:GDP-L-fucose synthase